MFEGTRDQRLKVIPPLPPLLVDTVHAYAGTRIVVGSQLGPSKPNVDARIPRDEQAVVFVWIFEMD